MDLSKIARDTRDLLLRMNPVISSVQTILSHDDNVHTTLDREIDTYLQHGLPGVLDAAIVSEERDLGSADLKDCFWLIDPVDGTINAISGSADWAISIALMISA
jgi:fructose-1,6-bisphosphatase/inositol monophosphatase family enzyme